MDVNQVLRVYGSERGFVIASEEPSAQVSEQVEAKQVDSSTEEE